MLWGCGEALNCQGAELKELYNGLGNAQVSWVYTGAVSWQRNPARRSSGVLDGFPLRGFAQYSAASMMVSTRFVFSGSPGSSDAIAAVGVVVVDLPVEGIIGDLEVSEIMLAIRIIVSGEVFERLHREQRLGLDVDRKLGDAARKHTWPPMNVERKLSLRTRILPRSILLGHGRPPLDETG